MKTTQPIRSKEIEHNRYTTIECGIMGNMAPNKLEIIRKNDGTFAKGTPPPNPAGRPKGKTLKEFAREYLMNLPDEKKQEYLDKLPAEIAWKMAEGNPHNTSDVMSGNEPIKTVFVQFIDKPEDAKDHTDTNGV